jgi:hypothetical protein
MLSTLSIIKGVKMIVGDVVQWRSLSKKNKFAIKTGVVFSISSDTVIVKSGRKKFNVSPSAIIS